MEEAERLGRISFTSFEEVYGSGHPNTVTRVHEWAVILEKSKRFQEASEMYQRAFRDSEKVLGHNRPETANYIRNYENFKRREQARGEIMVDDLTMS